MTSDPCTVEIAVPIAQPGLSLMRRRGAFDARRTPISLAASAPRDGASGAAQFLLSQLLADVVAARRSEQAQRGRGGVTSEALHAARLHTLEALIDYADAIEAMPWPVPRGLHMEIQLHRALCTLGPPRRISDAPNGRWQRPRD